MIDIHSHILPGIDDGASDIAESLIMAKMAVQDGISTMIATPHITGKTQGVGFIAKQVSALQTALDDAGIALKLAIGGEVPFHFGDDVSGFTLAGNQAILLELPHSHVPESTSQKIYELQREGYQVILAHLERNGGILQNPNTLKEFIDLGAESQITAESVTGELGSQIQHLAHHLLRQGMVHYLASDCHSSEHRKPQLAKAVAIASKIIGKKGARKLVQENPAALLTPSIQDHQ
jgi:protein-tyrosine phosphatase